MSETAKTLGLPKKYMLISCLFKNKLVNLWPNNNSMDANEKTLNAFTTRVRQMILQYNETKNENAELYAMVDERDSRIKELEAKLEQARRDYEMLKMAKMLEITDGDMESVQKRVSRLIRDVNKCITLLSES